MNVSDLTHLGDLGLAFVLSAALGLERELRQKSAGLRTYTLVGVSAALFMLVSKFGFMDVLVSNRIVVDPSRVAAQVVSGIGFIGGGVIFMRREAVRGLTTAASIWLVAAIGMACGANLVSLAVAASVAHAAIMFLLPRLAGLLPRSRRLATTLRVVYEDGRGLLRPILIACTELRFSIDHVRVEHDDRLRDSVEAARDAADLEGTDVPRRPPPGSVAICMEVKGKRPVSHLIARLTGLEGVLAVGSAEDETLD